MLRDVTLVSPLTHVRRPQPSGPSAATRDGAMISVAERRKMAKAPSVPRVAAPGAPAPMHPRVRSCGFVPNALLLPCAVPLPRAAGLAWVGCAAGGACSALLCKARLLRRCSARHHTSLGPCLMVVSSPRSGTSCTMQFPPPRAAWARSLQRARGPGLFCAVVKDAWAKELCPWQSVGSRPCAWMSSEVCCFVGSFVAHF